MEQRDCKNISWTNYMITLKELTELTNVSRKQINNRINKIKGKYPSFIKGGGRGKGGRYYIDSLFVKYLIRSNSTPILPQQDVNLSGDTKSLVGWKNFSKIRWKWFGCYSPVSIYDPKDLISLIPLQDGEIAFYSIHAKDTSENLHIHFVSNSEVTKTKLQTPCKGILMNSKIIEFDYLLMKECYDYYTNYDKMRSGQQYLVDYGMVMGVKRNQLLFNMSLS